MSASPAVSVAPDLVAVSGPTASVAPAGHPVPSPGLQRFGAVGGVLLALGLGVPGAVEAFTGETAATNREIASRLRLTEGTVKNHVSRILTRLSLRDRTQAALYARDQGLL
ncbi:response regulator transcription factor [Streptomyces sp. NPDC101132]|uniref:response regulator transcription factor n=1 Tax=Streptomyces sp. NPDC101132 TaxID=3366110 RepID=UPI00382E2D54